MATKRSSEIDAKFVGIEINSADGKCGIEGCSRPVSGRGVCLMHYKRISRFGRGFCINKADVKKHPSYSIWAASKRRQVLCEEWLEFRTFATAVGERPSQFHRLIRIDRTLPFGPNNFEWKSAPMMTATENGVVVQFPYKSSKDADARKDKRLRKKYRISLREYKEMLLSQDGCCAICGSEEVIAIRRKTFSLAVDHDHKTGKVRGILCHGCNRALGHMKDDPEILRAAADYLEKNSAPVVEQNKG